MKSTLIVLLSVFIIVSCSDSTKKAGEEVNKVEEQNVVSISLWDGVSIRETPQKSGKYLSGISLGEQVTYLGESSIDSLDKNREYLKVELSDGTIGWTGSFALATEAYAAALLEETTIFKRPDLLTATKKSFDKMEMVAVVKSNEDWIEVVGKQKKKSGWIKKDKITSKEEDVAVAILAQKNVVKDGEIQVDKIKDFIDNSPFKTSVFIDYLNSMLQEEIEEDLEEGYIMEADSI